MSLVDFSLGWLSHGRDLVRLFVVHVIYNLCCLLCCVHILLTLDHSPMWLENTHFCGTQTLSFLDVSLKYVFAVSLHSLHAAYG